MKSFALIDCNSFFASCERIFRPDLNNKPIIVLSNNDGCVIARSAEAKALGIKMGVPFFQIKNFVVQEKINVFSSNYTLYDDISRRIMTILTDMSSAIEIYSIDEAFIELDGMNNQFRKSFSLEIKTAIAQHIGIQVGIGIGPTKTLAKLANYAAKKYPNTNGIVDLTSPKVRERLLRITPVEEIWGIGRSLAKKLIAQNIITAWDLYNADIPTMQKKYSINMARTIQELHGIFCDTLEVIEPAKQQLIYSRSFSRPITEYEEMRQAVALYAENSAVRLRKEGLKTKDVSIFLSTNKHHSNFIFNESSFSSPYLTNDSREIVKLALKCLKNSWNDNQRYLKAGVILRNLKSNEGRQLELFSSGQSEKSEHLMKAIDCINNKHSHVVKLAINSGENSWSMRRKFLSPSYTTNWNDLPKVK